MKKQIRLRAVLLLALAAGGCFLLIRMHTAVFSLLARMTVQAAQSFLPTASVTRTAATTAPTAAPTTETAAETVPTKETTTAATTVPSTTAAADAFTATPQDILDRMAAAKKTAAGDKKGGSIKARTYVNDGVTDRAGNVRVKNTNKTQIDLPRLLTQRADLSVDKTQPTVLIFHTHTTETYQLLDRGFYSAGFATRSSDSGQNMVRVGDEICNALRNAGYRVLHDTKIHDARYTGAYERSRETVQQYLEKYPSLQITLDIHRDAIQLSDGTKIKPVAKINGKPAAQVMIISGCQEEGNSVSGFPDWRQNLVFAVRLQQQMETDFPGLTRPLFFCPRRYNMNLTHCSLLIEIGSDANTLEEAVYAGKCVGTSLAALMQSYEKEASE